MNVDREMGLEKLVLRTIKSFSGHERSVAMVKFSPDGKYLATGSADTTVRVWDVETGECKIILCGHTKGISDIAWSPDSQYIASGGDDALILVWSPFKASEPIQTLRGHSNYIFCLQFGPTGGMLASGSFDESIRLWDVRDGRCLRAIAAHADPVTGVSFGPDGSLLVSSSYDGLMYCFAPVATWAFDLFECRRVWDTFTGSCLKTIVDDDNPPVSSIKFSPNGKYILASTLDDHIRVWDVHSGKCVKSYSGHSNRQYCAPSSFFLPTGHDEMMVVSGSEDGRLLIWELNSRQVLLDEKVHEGALLGVGVHGKLPLLATCALEPDLEVKLHEINR